MRGAVMSGQVAVALATTPEPMHWSLALTLTVVVTEQAFVAGTVTLPVKAAAAEAQGAEAEFVRTDVSRAVDCAAMVDRAVDNVTGASLPDPGDLPSRVEVTTRA